MPKAWAVDQLKPDLPLSRGAALILAVKLPEVLSYEAAARAGGVDGIHDMRVAAKRLREAVRVLRTALPETARRRLLRQVERLNDALGLVRDRDVLGEALALIRKRDPRAGALKGLCRRLARERAEYHRDLLKFLRRLKTESFADFYATVMQEMAEAPPEGQPSVAEFARGAVGERLADVATHWIPALAPWEMVTFHRQRIRVKKLKYALEPFLALLPSTVAPLYDRIADLQELMGLVHDCDVQAEVLAAWVAEHDAEPGYALAAEDIARQRSRASMKLRVLVAAMEREDWSRQLLALLDATVGAEVRED